MRQIPLTTIRGGITRLRTKGGALNDSLYDLLNGYVTSARTVRQRQGTKRVHEIPPGTKGIVSFGGVLHVFATEQIANMPEGVELVVLRSPDASDDDPRTIKEIHFAEPFLGFLYVVAEFDDGNVYHYWLEDAETWEPNKEYTSGAIVQPTTGSTGVVFRARRGTDPYPVWTPNAFRDGPDSYGGPGEIVEPTVYNNFYYQVVATTGLNPRSGQIEPIWPTTTGAQVTEAPDIAPGGAPGSDPTAPPPPPPPPPPDGPAGSVKDRYGIDANRIVEQER